MRKRFWKGLRTIDLVIGVFIICMVLVVLALRYDEFKCRSMQSEAKFSLQEIFTAQQLFFAEYERFASLDELIKTDRRVVVPQKFYIVSDLSQPSQQSFEVIARGAPGTLVAGEEWSIDQTRELRLRKAVCNK